MVGRHAFALGEFFPLDEGNMTLTKRWLVRVQSDNLKGWLGMSSFDREYDAKREWEHWSLRGRASTIIDQFKQEGN